MKLREDYNRDGYVVIKRKCDPHVARMWGYSIGDEKSLSLRFNDSIENYVGYLKATSRISSLQYLIIQSYQKIDLAFHTPLIIEQPVLHVMSPSLRIPDGYYGTSAHQDWPSTQGSLDSVTVWIALTDANIGNFPLEVIPGSHKRGLLDGKMNGSVLEVEADEKEFIPIECKAGDVVFLSGFTVHRTGKGNGFRVAVSQRFDNACEPTFIERGYPCAQKRVVDREIKWKPTVEQVSQVFT